MHELSSDLQRYAQRRIAGLTETVLAHEALLDAEPMRPPSDARQRAAWDRRQRERRAAMRLAVAELAQLTTIERGAAERLGGSGDQPNP